MKEFVEFLRENWPIVLVAVIAIVAIPLCINSYIARCEYIDALRSYAKKTSGHMERYVTGSHVESRYAGSVKTGKSSTSIYMPVEVTDYSERIVYFDGRPPYYPEDHDEWKAELERIQREKKSAK